MDPRFVVTRDEFHDVQMDVKQVQFIQHSHAERLLRLEKRQADDAALKSVWNSPFPSVLGGTPQHGPVMPSNDVFDDIDGDDQSQNLLGSLHLDADYEPVRRGAASRANSVRFDESALHGANWAGNNGRHSGEFVPTRPTSGMGGHGMMERSLSHKSDGRHSSAGHSVHSMHSGVSGRASSLGLDTNFVIGGHDEDSPVDIPEPPPGLYFMGSVPSIIRCWLNTNFTSSTVLFAVVCTGSQKSTVDFSLVKELDLTSNVRRDADAVYRISLPVYLAEARVTQSNSRSPSPAPQLPSINATFEVTGADQSERAENKKSIRLFIGSDTLRMHSADLLLSRNLMTLYGNDRDKLSVPFVRPDDDAFFKHLVTTNAITEPPKLNAAAPEFVAGEKTKVTSQETASTTSQNHTVEEDSQILQSPRTSHVSPANKTVPPSSTTENGTSSEKQAAPRLPETSSDKEPASTPSESLSRRESSTAIWGPWRQGASANGSDGSKETGPLSGYQPASRSSRSMKVLKPSKSGGGLSSASSSSARTGSAYEPPPSRTSGEQRRKSGGTAGENGTAASFSSGGPGIIRWESKRTASGSAGTPSSASGGTAASTKGQPSNDSGAKSASSTPRSAANPLGSASAFSFLGKPKPTATPAAE
ncbi:hypothetical protein GE09DRAFT_963240 [Coniochaeta sp. 2T2.1]|nr:hypothetical protein GE09DRAFT_963240 [Coniochaeta sp. 2T2.1]